MTIELVFDLLDHAMEPEAWECTDTWEYRAMHWRPRKASQLVAACANLGEETGDPGGAMSNIGRELPPIEVVPDVAPEPVPESVPEPAQQPSQEPAPA